MAAHPQWKTLVTKNETAKYLCIYAYTLVYVLKKKVYRKQVDF